MTNLLYRKKILSGCYIWFFVFSAATGLHADELTVAYAPTEIALVAPNVDLKEVAPVPQPTPVTGPGVQAADEEAAAIVAEEKPSAASSRATQDDSFVILGAEVAAGTSTRLAWTADGNMSGLSTPTPVMVIRGKEPGKTMCMTAAIHGDELNGIEIIRRVMYDIEPESLTGNIIGVPIVNLNGFHRGSRYLSDRRDLNRYFPGEADGSLASRMAYSLFHDVIVHCDFLIDIHTGSLRRTNLPQIRADLRDPDVSELTEGFDKMAVMHSGATPGMLRFAALEHGIPAVTLEVGESLRIQQDKIENAVNSLNRLLERQGMYSRLFTWGEPEPVYYTSAWIRAEQGGILFSKKQLGAMIDKGEVLGTVTDPITNETLDIVSTMEGRIIGMAVNQFVMPGFATYHIGMEASEQVLADRTTQSSYEGMGLE
jgi:predicted deacylase